MKISKAHAVFFIFAWVFWAGPFVAHATRVKLVNLEEMVYGAHRIFLGTCVTVEDNTVPGTEIPVTTYTFSVLEPIKGEIKETVVLRQLGVRRPRVRSGKVLVFHVPGMPVYRVGQEVVLFLVADSPLGLASPVGLSQGAFTVVERQGKKMLKNGLQNAGLLNGLSQETNADKWKLSEDERTLLAIRKGPIDYELFMAVVKKILTQAQNRIK